VVVRERVPGPARTPEVADVLSTAVTTGYRILEHTADIGLEATAATPEDVFREAARALIAIAVDATSVEPSETCAVAVTGDDYPSLLVNFLDEIVYLFDSGRFAPAECEVVRLAPTRIDARLFGSARDPARHPWRLIVKAVTYHGLVVERHGDGWRARVFLVV
jgi:SHS2 domain-containing protein